MRSALFPLIFAGLFLASSTAPCWAQARVGIAAQAYPAGIIGVAQLDIPISNRTGFRMTGGYNATDRRDYGEHDHESGGGPGLGVSFARFFRNDSFGWFADARLDAWFLDIDWRDTRRQQTGTFEQRGSSSVTVIQPTGLLGYRNGTPSSSFVFDFTIGFGAEFNVSTSGEDVGSGAILLLGLGVVFNKVGKR